RSMKLGHNDSWIHFIDPYPFRRQLERRAASQLIYGGFADTVCQHSGKRARSGHTRYVHDIASRALKMRDCKIHEMKYRTQIYVHHLIPKLECCVLNAAGLQDTRGVTQHIESAHRLDRLCKTGLCLCCIRQVCDDD